MQRSGRNPRWLISAATAVGLVLSLVPNVAIGAILLPCDWGGKTAEKTRPGAMSGTRPTPVSVDDQPEDQSNPDAAPELLKPNAPIGSSSCGTSDSRGTNGLGSFAIDLKSVATSEGDLAGRILCEQRSTLPRPPCTDLLRPPQQPVL